MKDAIGKFFRSPSFKFMVIGTLSLLLLIPAAMIRNLISERENRNMEARMEISEKWGLAQTLTGPFLTIPTQELVRKTSRNEEYQYHRLQLLPENLRITGTIDPIKKKRGIFSTVVYTSTLRIEGHFSLQDEKVRQVLSKGIEEDKYYLSLGITDLRGIGNDSRVLVNGVESELKPGLYNHEISDKGIHVPLNSSGLSEDRLEFRVDLALNGSSDIFFTPLGKQTEVRIESPWTDPSFTGNFLPSEKDIAEAGFSATWKVNYLNRNYPQSWWDSKYYVNDSAFGVNFLIPVNHYQKSTRAVKYAFMFIALTFLVFFLTEVISKIRIHPIQYLLVGFALITFYTLLISLSEQIGFNKAYYISTAAVTLLIGYYIRTSAGSLRTGLVSASLLLALYAYLFTTLQLQDLSLLMGSLGLFIVLAIIMIISRKINWYKEENTTD